MKKNTLKSGYSHTLRSIAFFVLLSFILLNTFSSRFSYAQTVPTNIPNVDISKLDLSKTVQSLAIPDTLGTVQERFWPQSLRAKRSNLESEIASSPSAPRNDRLIIYVQNAHANLDSERNTQNLIAYFQKELNLPLVLLEGGEGKLDNLFFKSFPDKDLKEKILNSYLTKGDLSGGETASILFDGYDTAYYGIENQKLYDENKKAFLKALEKEQEISRRLDNIQTELNQKAKLILNSEVLEFRTKKAAFEKEEINLLEYVKFLSSLSKSSVIARSPKEATKQSTSTEIASASSVTQPRNDVQTTYPELAKILNAETNEKTFTGEDYDAATTKLIKSFQKKVLPKLPKPKQMEINQMIQLNQIGQLSQGMLVKRMEDLSKEMNFFFETPAVLKPAAHHAQTISSIKGTRVFDELKRLESDLRNQLPETREGKQLLNDEYYVSLLRQFSKLELLPEDWHLIQNQKPSDLLTQKPGEEFDSLFQPHYQFYELAGQRDKVLYQNISEITKKEKAKVVLVSTGGFHVTGITNQLKEANTPFVLVSPKINEFTERSVYLNAMQDKRSFMKYFNGSLWDALAQDYASKLAASLKSEELTPDLKRWRDRIIQNSIAEGRITQAGSYTKYVDALVQALRKEFEKGSPLEAKDQKLMSEDEIRKALEKELNSFINVYFNKIEALLKTKIQVFGDGLKDLWKSGNVNPKNIGDLLDRVSAVKTSNLAVSIALIREVVHEIPAEEGVAKALQGFNAQGIDQVMEIVEGLFDKNPQTAETVLKQALAASELNLDPEALNLANRLKFLSEDQKTKIRARIEKLKDRFAAPVESKGQVATVILQTPVTPVSSEAPQPAVAPARAEVRNAEAEKITRQILQNYGIEFLLNSGTLNFYPESPTIRGTQETLIPRIEIMIKESEDADAVMKNLFTTQGITLEQGSQRARYLSPQVAIKSSEHIDEFLVHQTLFGGIPFATPIVRVAFIKEGERPRVWYLEERGTPMKQAFDEAIKNNKQEAANLIHKVAALYRFFYDNDILPLQQDFMVFKDGRIGVTDEQVIQFKDENLSSAGWNKKKERWLNISASYYRDPSSLHISQDQDLSQWFQEGYENPNNYLDSRLIQSLQSKKPGPTRAEARTQKYSILFQDYYIRALPVGDLVRVEISGPAGSKIGIVSAPEYQKMEAQLKQYITNADFWKKSSIPILNKRMENYWNLLFEKVLNNFISGIPAPNIEGKNLDRMAETIADQLLNNDQITADKFYDALREIIRPTEAGEAQIIDSKTEEFIERFFAARGIPLDMQDPHQKELAESVYNRIQQVVRAAQREQSNVDLTHLNRQFLATKAVLDSLGDLSTVDLKQLKLVLWSLEDLKKKIENKVQYERLSKGHFYYEIGQKIEMLAEAIKKQELEKRKALEEIYKTQIKNLERLLEIYGQTLVEQVLRDLQLKDEKGSEAGGIIILDEKKKEEIIKELKFDTKSKELISVLLDYLNARAEARNRESISVANVLKEAEAEKVDGWQSLARKIGINPKVVKAGAQFKFSKDKDESFKFQHEGNDRTNAAVAKMYKNREKFISDESRLYHLGRGIPDDTWLAVHEMGHDMWLSSLNETQRKNFIEILIPIIRQYKKIHTFNPDYDFDGPDMQSQLLVNRSSLETEYIYRDIHLSEVFARVLGKLVRFPVPEPDTDFPYLNNPKSMNIFETFFKKNEILLSRQSQPLKRSEMRSVTITSQTDAQTQGRKNVQQDSYLIKRLELENIPHGKGLIVAIMDGHGVDGHRVANLIKDNLFEYFQLLMRLYKGQIRKSTFQMFSTLNEITKHESSGSTLTFAYIPDDEPAIHSANLGDSPALIFDNQRIIAKMPEHNVRNPKEKTSASKKGAQFDENLVYLQEPFTPDLTSPESFYASLLSLLTKKRIYLQLTRTLGDSSFEKILNRKPSYKKVNLPQEGDIFLVVASDGLYPDHSENKVETVAQFVRENPSVSAEELVEKAGGKNASDNVTAILMKLSVSASARAEARSNLRTQINQERFVEVVDRFDSLRKRIKSIHVTSGNKYQAVLNALDQGKDFLGTRNFIEASSTLLSVPIMVQQITEDAKWKPAAKKTEIIQTFEALNEGLNNLNEQILNFRKLDSEITREGVIELLKRYRNKTEEVISKVNNEGIKRNMWQFYIYNSLALILEAISITGLRNAKVAQQAIGSLDRYIEGSKDNPLIDSEAKQIFGEIQILLQNLNRYISEDIRSRTEEESRSEIRNQTTKALIDQLRPGSNYPRVQRTARFVLIHRAVELPEETLAELKQALKKEDGEYVRYEITRREVVSILGILARDKGIKSEVIPILIEALNDKKPVVRLEVISALTKVKPIRNEVFKALIDMLNDNDSRVRLSTQKVLIELLPESIDPLLELLQRGPPRQSAIAASILSNVKIDTTQRVIPSLLKATESKNQPVINESYRALVKLNSLDSIIYILFNHPRSLIRARAARSLGNIKIAENKRELIVQKLTEALTDKSRKVRLEAVNSLSQFLPLPSSQEQQVINGLDQIIGGEFKNYEGSRLQTAALKLYDRIFEQKKLSGRAEARVQNETEEIPLLPEGVKSATPLKGEELKIFLENQVKLLQTWEMDSNLGLPVRKRIPKLNDTSDYLFFSPQEIEQLISLGEIKVFKLFYEGGEENTIFYGPKLLNMDELFSLSDESLEKIEEMSLSVIGLYANKAIRSHNDLFAITVLNNLARIADKMNRNSFAENLRERAKEVGQSRAEARSQAFPFTLALDLENKARKFQNNLKKLEKIISLENEERIQNGDESLVSFISILQKLIGMSEAIKAVNSLLVKKDYDTIYHKDDFLFIAYVLARFSREVPPMAPQGPMIGQMMLQVQNLKLLHSNKAESQRTLELVPLKKSLQKEVDSLLGKIETDEESLEKSMEKYAYGLENSKEWSAIETNIIQEVQNLTLPAEDRIQMISENFPDMEPLKADLRKAKNEKEAAILLQKFQKDIYDTLNPALKAAIIAHIFEPIEKESSYVILREGPLDNIVRDMIEETKIIDLDNWETLTDAWKEILSNRSRTEVRHMVAPIDYDRERFRFLSKGAEATIYDNSTPANPDPTKIIKVFTEIREIHREHLERLISEINKLRHEGIPVVDDIKLITITDSTNVEVPALLMPFIPGESPIKLDMMDRLPIDKQIREILDKTDQITGGLADRHYNSVGEERIPYGNFRIREGGKLVSFDLISLKKLMAKMKQEQAEIQTEGNVSPRAEARNNDEEIKKASPLVQLATQYLLSQIQKWNSKVVFQEPSAKEKEKLQVLVEIPELGPKKAVFLFIHDPGKETYSVETRLWWLQVLPPPPNLRERDELLFSSHFLITLPQFEDAIKKGLTSLNNKLEQPIEETEFRGENLNEPPTSSQTLTNFFDEIETSLNDAERFLTKIPLAKQIALNNPSFRNFPQEYRDKAEDLLKKAGATITRVSLRLIYTYANDHYPEENNPYLQEAEAKLNYLNKRLTDLRNRAEARSFGLFPSNISVEGRESVEQSLAALAERNPQAYDNFIKTTRYDLNSNFQKSLSRILLEGLGLIDSQGDVPNGVQIILTDLTQEEELGLRPGRAEAREDNKPKSIQPEDVKKAVQSSTLLQDLFEDIAIISQSGNYLSGLLYGKATAGISIVSNGERITQLLSITNGIQGIDIDSNANKELIRVFLKLAKDNGFKTVDLKYVSDRSKSSLQKLLGKLLLDSGFKTKEEIQNAAHDYESLYQNQPGNEGTGITLLLEKLNLEVPFGKAIYKEKMLRPETRAEVRENRPTVVSPQPSAQPVLVEVQKMTEEQKQKTAESVGNFIADKFLAELFKLKEPEPIDLNSLLQNLQKAGLTPEAVKNLIVSLIEKRVSKELAQKRAQIVFARFYDGIVFPANPKSVSIDNIKDAFVAATNLPIPNDFDQFAQQVLNLIQNLTPVTTEEDTIKLVDQASVDHLRPLVIDLKNIHEDQLVVIDVIGQIRSEHSDLSDRAFIDYFKKNYSGQIAEILVYFFILNPHLKVKLVASKEISSDVFQKFNRNRLKNDGIKADQLSFSSSFSGQAAAALANQLGQIKTDYWLQPVDRQGNSIKLSPRVLQSLIGGTIELLSKRVNGISYNQINKHYQVDALEMLAAFVDLIASNSRTQLRIARAA